MIIFRQKKRFFQLSGGVSASKNGNSAGIEASRKTDGGTGDGSS